MFTWFANCVCLHRVLLATAANVCHLCTCAIRVRRSLYIYVLCLCVYIGIEKKIVKKSLGMDLSTISLSNGYIAFVHVSNSFRPTLLDELLHFFNIYKVHT